uniref:C2 domain-containing protein n=2 Tax=Cyclophora tenuis TaxID=216820 RepID=A0A7S1D519_CYCTE
MGTALFEVGSILGSRGNVQSKGLQTGGAVFVHIEKSRKDGLHGKMKFQLRGINLANLRRMGGKSSPYFQLYRRVDRPNGATWSKVYRSNVIKSNLNPKWDATELDLEVTCNGDLNRAMKVVVYDHRKGGKHKEMGEFETSMGRFIEAKNDGGDVNEDRGFTLQRNERIVGQICILQASIAELGGQMGRSDRLASQLSEIRITRGLSGSRRPPRPEFVDYLLGGCEISLAVAIDFTASNGNPHEPGTPHHFHPPESGQWNDYQKAIFAVGTILAKYDTDQRFPVWGFGAKYNGVIRNCFQCGDQVDVKGVPGILEAYQGVFNTQLTMSFPTVFTEVISTASRYAQHEQDMAGQGGNLSYTILLILTAGNLKDEAEIRQTKQELITASGSPLSVVIVGIGDNDFSGMAFLDEHDPQTEGGRDITKFVQFTEYKSYNLLTEAVLDEIPEQLVDYYYERGMMPGKAEAVNHDGIEQLPADDDARTVQFLG